MTKRIVWVDTGKYICIMFVMLSHLESRTDILKSFYSPFFLTAFFFLSGYVYRQPDSFREHLIRKVRGLFIPWLIFSNFNIFLSAVITLKGERNTLLELALNALQIRGMGDGVWFVAALFIAYIPFYFFIKWKKPVYACLFSAALSVISVLYCHFMNPALLPWNNVSWNNVSGSSAPLDIVSLPWHLEYMFQAMFWMVSGYYFRLYGEKVFDRFHNVRNQIVVWMIYLTAAYAPSGFRGGITRFLFPIYKVYWALSC